MKLVSGKLLKTLSYRIDKEIKKSLYQNEIFLKSRWNFLERNIVLWSIYYNKYVFLAFLLACLVAANLIVWQPWVKPFVLEHVKNWGKLLDWQDKFLSGQLTIVGVVYPLVVGLISVLFQNKSAKKTMFLIYQQYSGFMFSGLSGLALSGFIILGYFLRAHFDDSIYIAFCITSAFWLTSNILLTAWFFVQTFRMLDGGSIDRLILRFSIHESCEFDIRERIKNILIKDAIRLKLLNNPNKDVLKVVTVKYSDNDYNEVIRVVDRYGVIKDIRYRLINIAISLQILILKFRKIKGSTLIIHIPFRSSRNGKNMVVAQYNGFTINPIVRLLIKSAFSFSSQGLQSGIGLSGILNGIVGSANDALREGNTKDFSDAVVNIADWHTEIALALSFINDKGNKDNWLLLSNRFFFGRSYLEELLGEYYRLARDSVEKIPENSNFYNEMLYLHKKIFLSRDEFVNEEIRSLIQGSYNMWYLLIEWRSYSSNSGDMRIANKYEDILYDFVGAWETWLMYIAPLLKRTGDINRSYLALITHLEFTASMAISALRFNNYEAAGWGVDMLNNWLEKLSYDEHIPGEYMWRSVLLNHYFLLKDSNEPVWQVILKGKEYDYLGVFGLSFKNASFDLRVITACYILIKPWQEQQELLVNYVKALLSGESIHKTETIGRSQHIISSAGDLLGAYIRHRDYRHFGDGRYGEWFSSILESFGRIYEERRVSGRIYSGWGANDPISMNKAYVEIAISFSERTWGLPDDWKEAILSDAFRHRDRELIVSDLRDWIKIAQEDRSYVLFKYEVKKTLIFNFCESVEKIIESIEKKQFEDVAKATLDDERLRILGIGSSAVFIKSELPVPLCWFENRHYLTQMDDIYLYENTIGEYKKERVAAGVDTNKSINEERCYADFIKNNVKTNVLQKLIKHPISEFCTYRSIDNMFLDIREKLEFFACPVLFVGVQAVEKKLRSSIYDRDIAANYDISRSDGFDKDYICHIGRCEVYNLHFTGIDYCLLTTKELFDTINFRQIAEQQFVEVDFVSVNENNGKLKLKYWMDVKLLEDIPCIKLDLK